MSDTKENNEKGGAFADGSLTPEWYRQWVEDYQGAVHAMQAGVAMEMN
jgi:hypothetical protein